MAVLKKAEFELRKYKAWIEDFPAALRAAQQSSTDIPDGHVWQDEFVDYWTPFDSIQRQMYDLDEVLEDIQLEKGDFAHYAEQARRYLDPPRKAQIEYAIANPEFRRHPGQDRDLIAYPETRLVQWFRNASRWVEQALRSLQKVVSKAKHDF